MRIQRKGLEKQVFSSSANLILLVASAGCGKTTFANDLLAKREITAVVDCSRVSDTHFFCAACDARPAGHLAGAGQAAIPVAPADRRHDGCPNGRAALLNWASTASGPTAILFDNVEAIVTDTELMLQLGDLIASRPANCQIVLASRCPVPITFGHTLAPHQVLELRAKDLVFDARELSEIFERSAVSSEDQEVIASISQGWPIAVFLLVRLAKEGQIPALLGRFDDPAYDNFHKYLREEVMAALPEGVIRAMVAAAAIPDCTVAELSAILPWDDLSADLAAMSRINAFSIFDHNQVRIAPLLKTALLKNHSTIARATLAAAAVAARNGGDLLRAAELFLEMHDSSKAALTLHEFQLLHAEASPRMLSLLASIDSNILCHFPTLWAVLAYRNSAVDNVRALAAIEAELQNLVASNASQSSCDAVRLSVAISARRVGELTKSKGKIDEVLRSMHTTNDTFPCALIESALLKAECGHVPEARRDWAHAKSLDPFLEARFSLHRLEIKTLLSWTGDWEQRLAAVRRILVSAAPLANTRTVVECLHRLAFNAWLRGDQIVLHEMLSRIEGLPPSDYVRELRPVASLLRGEETADGADMAPRWRMAQHLIRASHDVSDRERRALIEAMSKFSNSREDPLLEVLALALRATFDPEGSAQHLKRAQALCQDRKGAFLDIDSALEAGDLRRVAAFAGLAERWDALLRRQSKGEIRLCMIERSLTIGGAALMLSDKSFVLLAFLVLHSGVVPKEYIADALWPTLSIQSQMNALKSGIHRLRLQVTNPLLVVSTKGGYLVDGIPSPLDVYESALREMNIEMLRHVAVQTAQSFPQCLLDEEWFEPFATRFERVGEKALMALGENSLEEARYADALYYAEELLHRDPCNESAYGIAIRAHLGRQDRFSATREFHRYRDILSRELGLNPSSNLQNLVNAG